MSRELIDTVFAWLFTYAIHSTLLLGLAWLVSRRERISAFAQDLIWKVALVGGLLTSLVQSQLGARTLGSIAVSRPPSVAPGAAVQTAMPPRADASAPELVVAERIATREEAMANAGIESNNSVAGPAPVASRFADITWTSVVVIAWAALAALFVLTHFARRLMLMGRLASRRAIVDGPLPAMLDSLCRTVGYSTHVRLTSVNSISSPVALGLHEICVPEAVLTDLEPEQQRSLLAHELAHLARRDPLWLILATLLERCFFFQPLNRVARRALQRNAEYLCDDWAATQAGSGLPLARCLERVAEWMETSPLGVPVAGMAEQRSLLVSRIARLISGRRASSTPQVALSAGSVLILALTTAAAPGVRSEVSAEAPGQRNLAIEQPSRVSDDREGNGETEAETPATSQAPGALAGASLATAQSLTPSSLSHDAALEHQTAPSEAGPSLAEHIPRAGGPNSRGSSESDLPEDPAVIAALIERLKDTDAGVRRAAASSLGRLKSRSAVSALIAAMGDRNREVRAAVVEALSHMEDRNAVPALQRALTDESAEVRRSALNGLSEFSDDLRADVIVPALKDADPEVRAGAAELLGSIGDRASADELSPLLKDGQADVRHRALHALSKLEARSAAPAMLQLLRDSHADVRSAALEALGEIKIVIPEQEILALLTDANADVRSHAVNYISRNPSAAFVPVLRRLLDDPSSDVRENAVQALSEIRDPGARAALKAALSSDDVKVRRAAADALGERR